MNLFLEQKYKYIVFEPVENVRSQLKSIVKTPWYDLAVNLAGRVNEDNTFQLHSKLSMGINVIGTMQNFVLLAGKLEQQKERTQINIEVRPNYSVLFAFYLILLIFIFKLVEVFISNMFSDWMLAIFLFLFIVFVRSLIYFSIGQLKNRFEKTLLIHPEEE